MLAQKPKKQEKVDLPNDPFMTSGSFYRSIEDAPGWNKNSNFIGYDITHYEAFNDTTFKDGHVFFEADNSGPSKVMNVRRVGEFGLGKATQYQKYKVLESNVNSQEGKIYWLRTESVAQTNLIETNDGTASKSTISLHSGNALTHKFTADKDIKYKNSSGDLVEKDSAFTFDVTGSKNTGNYHWLQFVWREIYGTDSGNEEFLDDQVNTTGGTYYLTEDHTPQERNLNPDTGGAPTPWYGGATQRTAKTAKILDRPSSMYQKVKADVPNDWTSVHSKFHGITYLAHDDGAHIDLKHEYKFELDWFFGSQHKDDPTSLMPLNMAAVKPTTTLSGTKSTSKMDPEAKESFQQHYSSYADRLRE